MAGETHALTDVERALVQAFMANRTFKESQLKRALASILTASNRLVGGANVGNDALVVDQDSITTEQIGEYISTINTALYDLDYEVRCTQTENNGLVWELVRFIA
ncbi:uncharacterized protein V1518DRAFT_407930 [Limtongia smithiae]|uniref:uncharacterized protein n=1 Tax=Limtongia smithiae TaxID=1125753 RepID=UPI0034CE1735